MSFTLLAQALRQYISSLETFKYKHSTNQMRKHTIDMTLKSGEMVGVLLVIVLNYLNNQIDKKHISNEDLRNCIIYSSE